MSGWFKGTVREVVSGDVVVIAGASKPGAPAPEKRITLSSLVAPRLGKRDGTTRDEPFAWESREFLRNKLIGKACVFKVDYVVQAAGNREFGTVILQNGSQQENVALSVVAAGWAKVREAREGSSTQSPIIDELKKAEEAAQAAGLGLWTKDSAKQAAAVRPSLDADFDAVGLLNSVGKGKPVAAIVEAVLNGSTLRVTLLPDLTPATVAVCGVQCPSMGKRPPPAAAANGAGAEGDAGSAASAVGGEANGAAPVQVSEPGAREAKYFTESRCLNREVRLVLEGTDKYSNLFADVFYPEPDGSKATNLAEDLMSAGLAKAVEWSLNMMTVGAQRLREMERTAKKERKGMWHAYVPANTGQTKLSDNYMGKVIEVASGDTLVIKDTAAGVERRVVLSSIRAPRVGMRERAPEPWGNDAREFLRKKLIGKEVQVQMEYNRKVPTGAPEGAAPTGEERVLSFGNVELTSGPEDQRNAAEMVVARGFATVVRHRTDEERSGIYERLVAVEELAKSAKRGIHSAREPASVRPNDVSTPANAARAKAFLQSFQRAGKLQATVEFVLSGHRLKLYVPKENVTIAFAPSGIRTPSRAMPASNGRPAVNQEPYADDAISFTREVFMQRDVEIEIETMDKGGTFLGTITLANTAKQTNLALALLRGGLAKLQPFFSAERVRGGSELAAAEAAARDARLKVWENWTPEAEGDADEEGTADAAANGAGASSSKGTETLTVTVTEVTDAEEFFLQVVDEPRVGWIEEQLRNLSVTDGPAATGLTVGSQCMAKFSLDNNWYRAYVEKVHASEPRFEVYFLDYGNRERLPSERLRTLDAALAAVPPQARPAALAHVKLPSLDSEWGSEALATFSELVGGGKRLVASVVGRERGVARERHPKKAAGKLLVTLAAANAGLEASVAAQLLSAGMARLPKLRKVRDPAARDAINALSQFEEEARKAHRGMWQYGDPGDSDDEAEMAAAAARGTGAGRGGKR